jgi:hypothetical protein
MGSVNSSDPTDDNLRTFFENNAFNFKGSDKLPICQQCFYCKCQRFTDEEVKILSDPNLTLAQFKTYDFGRAKPLSCLKCSLTDHSPFRDVIYNFYEIWSIDYNQYDVLYREYFEFPNKYR